MGSYVGIDLHRRRSVIVVLNDDGDRVSWSRIDNTPANLAPRFSCRRRAKVAMERWGWGGCRGVGGATRPSLLRSFATTPPTRPRPG